jgi:hypothetical protein
MRRGGDLGGRLWLTAAPAWCDELVVLEELLLVEQ